MIKQLTLFLICIAFLPGYHLSGQNENSKAELSDQQGFTPEQWTKISDKWLSSQSAVMVSTYEGKHLFGQPVHAGLYTLYLSESTILPVGPDWFASIHEIPFHEIEKVLVQKGGNLATRAKKSKEYRIPKKSMYVSQGYQELKKSSIFRDSLVYPDKIEDAFLHSPALRQVYPIKRLRISISAGFGGDGVTADARAALEASPLPRPEDGYGSTAAIEILDVSWRFMNRIIIGGQLAARNTSGTLYAYNNREFFYSSYNYDVNYLEHRLYAEYAFFHVDRYFTKRWELLAGAGALFGRPQWSLYYNYDEYSDPDNPVYGEERLEQADPLMGFQIRSAFHLYIFPGFSLWSGLEANFIGPWTIHQVEIPSNIPSVPIVLQEHTLSFSSVRFKLGVSIYL